MQITRSYTFKYSEVAKLLGLKGIIIQTQDDDESKIIMIVTEEEFQEEKPKK